MRARSGPGKAWLQGSGERDGGRVVGEPRAGAIVLYVLLILVFACEVFLGGTWLAEASLILLAGVFVAIAGPLLGAAFAPGGPALRTLTVVAAVLVVVVAVALGSLGAYASSKDEDVTASVEIGGKPDEMADGDGLALTVPVARERDRLRLRVAGRDLPNGGSPCLPDAKLTATGAQLKGDLQVRFAGGVAEFDFPVGRGKKEVSLQLLLQVEEFCRITLELKDAVLTDDKLPGGAA